MLNASAETYYDGKCIKIMLGQYLESFVYTDSAGGESDSVSLTLGDPRRQWISAWLPTKGDEIKSVIKCEDGGKTNSLQCGVFVLDELSFSDGSGGSTFRLSGVSAPASDGFSATKRTRTWEYITLKQLAKTIADRYQLRLVFDAEDISLGAQEQSEDTDSAFLQDICDDYGLQLKIYRYTLVIFDRERYQAKPAAAVIAREDMTAFSWNTTLAGTYTGGTISYTGQKRGDTHTYSTGGGKRILTVSKKAHNLADAKLKLDAALKNANHGMTTATFSTMGRTDLVASQCVTLTGLGKLSGKYYIDKKTDSVSGSGYTSRFEASLVQSSVQEVGYDAIERLHTLGVMNNPSYWRSHYHDLEELGGLIINMATVIRTNAKQTGYTGHCEQAIEHLAQRGVINTPAYWMQHKGDIASLQELLINAANALA